MNIKRYILLLPFLILLEITPVSSQSAWQVGTMPSININKGFKNDWGLNFQWESRQAYFYGVFSETPKKDPIFILNDISLMGSKKVGFRTSLAAGYLVRIVGGKVIHRIKQQVTFVQRLSAVRLAHRVAADQAFSAHFSPEYRLRYRLSAEIPLSGQDIDPKEFYLKISNEYLLSLQGGDISLETRIKPVAGYEISLSHKMEAGLDYRIDSIIEGLVRNVFWISVSWYYRLPSK